MYIFARTRVIDSARTADAIRAGLELAAKGTEVTGLTTNLWLQAFAPTGPALVSTTRFDHLADMDRAWGLLMESTDYHDAMAELDEYLTGPPVEAVIEPIAGAPPADPTPFVSSVQASATNGHLRAAMHWGADVAERVQSSMDVPTIFARSLWGPYGTLFWASYFDDADHIEDTNAKMAADEMMQAVIDEGAHNVQPDAVATVMRKLT